MRNVELRMQNIYVQIRVIRGDYFLYFCVFKLNIIMAGIKDLINSAGYKAFMKKLLVYALIVFVLGIIFWLCKLPGGIVMTKVGGSTLIVRLVFFAIEILTKNNS